MHKIKKVLVGFAVVGTVLATCVITSLAEGNRIGIIKATELNVRQNSNVYSGILCSIPGGTKVTILDSKDGWHKVSYYGVTGWIYSGYVSLSEVATEGYLTGDYVNIRSMPNTSARVIGNLNKGAKVGIITAENGWTKVSLSDGRIGWIYSTYISAKDTANRGGYSATGYQALKETWVNNGGNDIVDFAKKFLGVRYVYGGNVPATGFDCSGYIKYLYGNYGVNLERVAAEQAKQGTWISKSELKPGDLVFFDTRGGRSYINHVGMYVGNGSFIHASSARCSRGVIVSGLNEPFYLNTYMCAKRVL